MPPGIHGRATQHATTPATDLRTAPAATDVTGRAPAAQPHGFFDKLKRRAVACLPICGAPGPKPQESLRPRVSLPRPGEAMRSPPMRPSPQILAGGQHLNVGTPKPPMVADAGQDALGTVRAAGNAKPRVTLAALMAQERPFLYGGTPAHGPAAQGVKPPSAQKQQFLKTGLVGNPAVKEPYTPQRLAFSDVKKLADSYGRTHGASIHIAGEVLPDLLRDKHDLFADTWHADLDAMMAAPDAGIRLLELCWNDFRDDKALGKLGKATDLADPKVRQALSERVDANHLGIRDRLLARAYVMRQEIPQRADKFGLNAKEGAQELQALAANPGGAAHGYMYPTKLTDRLGNGHAETFVVSSAGKVINVIPFPPQGAPQVAGQYSADVGALMLDGRLVSSQAGKIGCGTLGLSYLKQYLKDDARQLNEGSLLVDAQIDGKAVNFHLPSAQVLKYSQSDLYAKVMRAIVAGEEPTAKVHHNGREHEVRTLKGMVDAGATIGRPDGGAMTGGLEAFRAAWLAQCDASDQQRAQMRAGDRNHYLAYSSARLTEKVSKDAAGN